MSACVCIYLFLFNQHLACTFIFIQTPFCHHLQLAPAAGHSLLGRISELNQAGSQQTWLYLRGQHPVSFLAHLAWWLWCSPVPALLVFSWGPPQGRPLFWKELFRDRSRVWPLCCFVTQFSSAGGGTVSSHWATSLAPFFVFQETFLF